jgi:hypothetical protein
MVLFDIVANPPHPLDMAVVIADTFVCNHHLYSVRTFG